MSDQAKAIGNQTSFQVRVEEASQKKEAKAEAPEKEAKMGRRGKQIPCQAISKAVELLLQAKGFASTWPLLVVVTIQHAGSKD